MSDWPRELVVIGASLGPVAMFLLGLIRQSLVSLRSRVTVLEQKIARLEATQERGREIS